DLQLEPNTGYGTLSPDHVHVAPNQPAGFQFNADDQPHSGAIRASGTSRRGRLLQYLDAQTEAAPTFPYYYRILSSSYSTHADGQTMPGNNTNVCESQGIHAGGTEDWKGSSGALPFSQANLVSRSTSAGTLSGRIWADVPATDDAS